MGACCTRNDLTGSEILNSPKRNDTDLFDSTRHLELYNDSRIYENPKINNSINSLLETLKQSQISSAKKMTISDLWNITIQYKENHTNSNFLVFDLRLHFLQNENFIKKMKHINYSYIELKNMKNEKSEKFANFKKFIHNKNIIFILANEKTDFCFSLITFLYELDSSIRIYILNTTLILEELSPLSKKLHNYLEEKNYDILPYIFFTNAHLSTVKKEGFLFLNMENPDLPSGNLFQNNCEVNEFVFGFFQNFQIGCILNIINEQAFDIKELQIKSANNCVLACKEFFIGVESNDELYEYKESILKICLIIKKEMLKGKSIIINVKKNEKFDFIIILVLILHKLSNIEVKKLLNYLEDRLMFLENVKERILKNMSFFQSFDS